MFIKGFNKDLKGYGGFQFKVGEVYSTEQEHPWDWFNYGDKASTTLCFYHEVDSRFCEVQPLGKIYKLRQRDSIRITAHSSNSLRIIRELSREEVYAMLIKENCPWWLTNLLMPPFEVMVQYGNRIRGKWVIQEIIKDRDDFTLEQKYTLLPKKYHRKARYHDMTMALLKKHHMQSDGLIQQSHQAAGGN